MQAPLVSCILPTRNRVGLIGIAISSFLSQTYPHKELIILDNGDDGTGLVIPSDPSIRYVKISGDLTTGDMRNKCCRMAQGEFIAHFDSDDWSAPTRLETQMRAMVDKTGVLTGYYNMLFFDPRDQRCFIWSMSTTKFALGTSLLYRKDWWKDHPFASLTVGEDYQFFNQALREQGSLVFTEDVAQQMVALIHAGQTSPKTTESATYRKIRLEEMPKEFFAVQYHQ